MKTMTCRQLGGPCEHQHQGHSINDIITAQERHLKEAAHRANTSHHWAREAMRSRRRRPKESWGWYNQMKNVFAKLPTDPV